MTGSDTVTKEDVLTDPGSILFDPATANAPHSVYRRLRDECPVARVDGFEAATRWSSCRSTPT